MVLRSYEMHLEQNLKTCEKHVCVKTVLQMLHALFYVT
jgi:hypothetical protein